jgi:hypothetical protein
MQGPKSYAANKSYQFILLIASRMPNVTYNVPRQRSNQSPIFWFDLKVDAIRDPISIRGVCSKNSNTTISVQCSNNRIVAGPAPSTTNCGRNAM